MLTQVQGGTALTGTQLSSLGVGKGVQDMLNTLPPSERQSVETSFLEMAPTSGGTYTSDPVAIGAAIGRFAAAYEAIHGSPTTPDNNSGSSTIIMGATSTNWLLDGTGLSDDKLDQLLAAAMIKQSNSEEQNALSSVLSARENAKAALLGQAGKLHDEANEMRSSALTALIVTCVTAAASCIMAGVSIGYSVKADRMMNKVELPGAGGEKPPIDEGEGSGLAPKSSTESESALDADIDKVNSQDKFQLDMKKIGAVENKAQTMNTIGQMFTNVGQGVGGYFSSMGQAAAKDIEAEGDVMAAYAQEFQANADMANSVLQKVNDNSKQIIAFLQAVQQAKSDAMASIKG
jgi:hypothetical protein